MITDLIILFAAGFKELKEDLMIDDINTSSSTV